MKQPFKWAHVEVSFMVLQCPWVALVGTVPVGTMPVGILPVGTVTCTLTANVTRGFGENLEKLSWLVIP